MTNTAREILTADFQARKSHGLKDLKFFFGNTVSDSTVEEVCAEVNKIYAEVANGNVIVQKSWNDSQRSKTTA
jgi:hypothetical protein